jgi:hypothetical protein
MKLKTIRDAAAVVLMQDIIIIGAIIPNTALERALLCREAL